MISFEAVISPFFLRAKFSSFVPKNLRNLHYFKYMPTKLFADFLSLTLDINLFQT